MKKSLFSIMFLTIIVICFSGCKPEPEPKIYTNTFSIGDKEYNIKHAYFLKDDKTSIFVFTSDEIESENNVIASIIFNDNSEWEETEFGTSSNNTEFIVKEIATDKIGTAISGSISLDLTGETYSISSKDIIVMFIEIEGQLKVSSNISFQGKVEDIPYNNRAFLTF